MTPKQFLKHMIRQKKALGTWQVLRKSSKLWLIECWEKSYNDYKLKEFAKTKGDIKHESI